MFETEFKLNQGKLIKLDEHIYNSFEYSELHLKKNEINRETIGLETFIRFYKSNKYIIDFKDTIEIRKVYPKEKLIFVNRNDGRINIYEYK